MISFFQKKKYLVDLLDGFTDIHNHILPGIDDGSTSVEESINLLLKFRSIGITNFIATPHVMNDYYPNTPDTINNSLRNLKAAVSQNQDLNLVKIKAAGEYMMDQNFYELIEKEKLLVLKENYVLVEMSYFQAPINLYEILFKMQTNGYKPVLAHPERYAFYHSKNLMKYEELKNRGCNFQVNMLSLSNHYGKNIQKTAFQLLEKGMIDFIGSDVHREQHLKKIENILLKPKIYEQVKKVIETTRDNF